MTFKAPFAFPISLWGTQTVFIQGENKDEPMAESNGSGKSNLLEALTFALYGKISKKLRYLDDIINLESDEAVVQVGFTLNDEYYSIKRNRSKSKTNEIHIFKRVNNDDVEEIPDSDNTEKQLYIEKLIGLTFLSYSHTIMFCQRFVAFPELKAPQRAAVLSEISGADVYLKAAEMAKERVTALRNLIAERERDKKHVEELLEQLDLNKISNMAEEWEEQHGDAIIELHRQMSQTEKELIEYRKKHDRAVKAEKLIILSLQERIKDALTWLADLPEAVKDKETKNNQYIQTESQVRAAKGRLNEKSREIDRLEQAEAGDCPYCAQAITQETLKEHIITLKIDFDYLKREWLTLSSILKDEEEAYDKAEETVRKLNNLKNEVHTANGDVRKGEQAITNLENRVDEKLLIDKMALINTQITSKKVEKSPYIGIEAEARKKMGENHKRLEVLNKEIKELNNDLQYFVVWSENFPKLRMMLLDDLVAELEIECQGWLAKYCSELSVELDTQRHTASGNIRDEVNITIITPKGKVSYEGYGGGETQKIRMAISLALSSIIAEKAEREYNLIIFDEVSSGLDRMGKDGNIEVFKTLSQNKTVMVIEHDEYFCEKMDEEITVVKENHQSYIQGI